MRILAGAALCVSLAVTTLPTPALAAPVPALIRVAPEPPQGIRHACDTGCPRMPAPKFAARKYRQNQMGRRKVFSAADLFRYPRGSRQLMRRQLATSLREKWGVRSNWPYTPAEGVRRLTSRQSCVARGNRYSPYTYGIGVCQPRHTDLNLTHRQVAQAGVMIACAAGPAYVIATAGSSTPLYVALVQGSGCGFAAWLATSG